MHEKINVQIVGKNVKETECPCCRNIVLSANDVCDALEIEDADEAVAKLDPDLKCELTIQPDMHESKDSKIRKLPQTEVFINYVGLFSLILQSPSPMAVKLRRFLSDWYLNAIFVYGMDTENDLWMDDLEKLRGELKEKFELIPFEFGSMGADAQ
jgi:prophage antirepressor-like protein